MDNSLRGTFFMTDNREEARGYNYLTKETYHLRIEKTIIFFASSIEKAYLCIP